MEKNHVDNVLAYAMRGWNVLLLYTRHGSRNVICLVAVKADRINEGQNHFRFNSENVDELVQKWSIANRLANNSPLFLREPGSLKP